MILAELLSFRISTKPQCLGPTRPPPSFHHEGPFPCRSGGRLRPLLRISVRSSGRIFVLFLYGYRWYSRPCTYIHSPSGNTHYHAWVHQQIHPNTLHGARVRFLNIFYATSSMKFILRIEATLVLVGSIGSLPLKNTLHSSSFVELTVEFIIIPYFFPQALIGIVLEATCIGDCFWFEGGMFWIGFVVFEISIVVWSVGEDEDSRPVCLAIKEVPDVKTTVIFIHLSEAMRAFRGLDRGKATSSRTPT